LLFNPDADGLQGVRGEWKKVQRYDTPWLCEQGRREEAAEHAEETAKDADAKWPRPTGPRSPSSGTLAALLKYRCQYEKPQRSRSAEQR
jgi:hypothetical protein